MAILIFSKNSDGLEGALYKMAASQSIYDANKNWNDDLYDLVTISDADAAAVRNYSKIVVSKTGNTVTFRDGTTTIDPITTAEELDKRKARIAGWIRDWLKGNSNKPMASSVQTYLTYLDNIVSADVIAAEGSIQSVEKYVVDQGQTAFHPLELL